MIVFRQLPSRSTCLQGTKLAGAGQLLDGEGEVPADAVEFLQALAAETGHKLIHRLVQSKDGFGGPAIGAHPVEAVASAFKQVGMHRQPVGNGAVVHVVFPPCLLYARTLKRD
jgi:hypothetical protein